MELQDNASIVSLTYVVLRTVYPALKMDDIREVRAVHARGGMRVENNWEGSAPFKREVNGLPSVLVTLPNRELVNRIIRAKNAYSYLSTNDVDIRSKHLSSSAA